MKNVIKNNLNQWIMIYIILFFIYTVIGRIVPLNAVIPGSINGLIYNTFAGTGVLLIISDLFTDRFILKSKYIKVLMLFLIIMGISSILNMQYGILDNIKTIVWTLIQFTIFYSYYVRVSKEQFKRTLLYIFIIVNIIWVIATLVSIIQYLFMIGYRVVALGVSKRQGFYESRLFGVFTDPNFAAMTCLYMIISITVFFKRFKGKLTKVFYIICALLYYCYIILSGSRTIMVCSIVLLCLFVFLFYLKEIVQVKEMKQRLFSLIKGVVITTLSVVILLGSMKVIGIGLSKIPFMINSSVIAKKDDVLKREDINEDNISNNRFTIWNSYITNINNKWVFGVSPRNGITYIKENSPKSYISRTSYETHNGYINLYVSTGLIGLSVMSSFILLSGYNAIKKYFNSKNYNYFLVLSIVVGILIYSFFFTELFFVNNLTTAVFWTLAGYINNKEVEKETLE